MLNQFLNEKIDVLDMLSILSFYIGLKNLDENITQNDLQELVNKAIEDIHTHLKEQDKRLERIEVLLNDKNKGTSWPYFRWIMWS